MNVEEIKEQIGNSLLTIGTIVGVFYTFGYIEHRTHLYIFGLDYQLEELGIFTNGADFLLASIIDSVRYIISHPLKIFFSFFYSELRWSTIIMILALVLVIFGGKFRKSSVFKYLIYSLITLFCLNIISFQSNLFEANNLLQPQGYEFMNDISLNDYNGFKDEEKIRGLYKGYVINTDENENFQKFFAPESNSTDNRINYYSALLLLLISFGLIVFFYVKEKRALIPFIFCIFFLPTTYSFIGKDLRYPLVRIQSNNHSESKLGVLVGRTDSQSILYSIQDDFKVFYFQNERIEFIETYNNKHILSPNNPEAFITVKPNSQKNKLVQVNNTNKTINDEEKDKIVKVKLVEKRNIQIDTLRNFMVPVHEISTNKTIIGLKLKNFVNTENYIFNVESNGESINHKTKLIQDNYVLLEYDKNLASIIVNIYDADSTKISYKYSSERKRKSFVNFKSLESNFPILFDNTKLEN